MQKTLKMTLDFTFYLHFPYVLLCPLCHIKLFLQVRVSAKYFRSHDLFLYVNTINGGTTQSRSSVYLWMLEVAFLGKL